MQNCTPENRKKASSSYTYHTATPRTEAELIPSTLLSQLIHQEELWETISKSPPVLSRQTSIKAQIKGGKDEKSYLESFRTDFKPHVHVVIMNSLCVKLSLISNNKKQFLRTHNWFSPWQITEWPKERLKGGREGRRLCRWASGISLTYKSWCGSRYRMTCVVLWDSFWIYFM